MSRKPQQEPTLPGENRTIVAPEATPAELSMASRQRLTGSAAGVGSVGFAESGAFDVGADEHHPEDEPIVEVDYGPRP